MMTRRLTISCLAVLALVPSGAWAAEEYPAAPGFDLEGSDPKAVEMAEAVMERLGGWAAWDETRYLTWNFFDRRRHFWDKHTGDVRIEGVGREDGVPYLILMNLHSLEGRAWRDGVEASGDELTELLELGQSAWINDSYWIFMPYKLKDSGVTLKYVGEREMQGGGAAEVLELTFREVGRTPDNRYHVYVASGSGLVEQWDFYQQATDEEPRFQIPWGDWRRFGEIMLSDDRGESGHTDVAVFEDLPLSIFSSPEPVELTALGLGAD